MAEDLKIYTYHCLCAHLSYATRVPLNAMPKRKLDGSSIGVCTQANTPRTDVLDFKSLKDTKPMVVKLEDGFEKRYPLRCGRCATIQGYRLDKSQFEGAGNEAGANEEVLYILPGGLLTTDEMMSGKNMEKEAELVVAG